MKKLLLGVSLLAATAGAGDFDRMYGGVNVDYAFSQVEYQDKSPKTKGDFGTKKNDANGFEAGLFFGQGFQSGDMHYSFEASAGTGFKTNKKNIEKVDKSKKYDMEIKTKRGFKFGLGGRVGMVFDNVLVYGRLNLNATQYLSRVMVTERAKRSTFDVKSNNFWSYAVAPGVGVEWCFSKGMNARLEYSHEFSFTNESYKVGNNKVDIKEPSTNLITLGVSFAI